MNFNDPLVIIDQQEDGTLQTYILRVDGMLYEHYAMMAYDLVRHIAKAFKVSEDEVWDMVKRERSRPTTDIKIPS